MKRLSRTAALLLPLLALAAAAPPTAPAPQGGKTIPAKQILDAAPADAWLTFSPEDLLVIDLDTGQRVVIALAADYAPVHVANIRALTRAGWFAGITINRVQDNYVTQWGDLTEKKPLPAGIVAAPPAEYERPAAGLGFRAMAYRDAYAPEVGHAGGWAVARDGKAAWLPHCYGMVGVGRGLAPDVGTGAELYAVIGHSPRALDRNIAIAGRVLSGMEALTALPRGTEELGFYKAGVARPAIRKAMLAADMPATDRPAYRVLRADSPVFAQWLGARANRRDEFFERPAGAIDVCNSLPPVRPVAKG